MTFGELDEPTARAVGVEAIKITFDQLMPQLGTPVAVQRRLEWTLAPGLEWGILGFLDLETERFDFATQDIVREVVDYKVKGGNAINQPGDTRSGRNYSGRGRVIYSG